MNDLTTTLKSLKAKAENVHIASLNLATTLGTFHGINDSFKGASLTGHGIRAINSIQFDLLHIMVVRVCALCERGKRNDDASIRVLTEALNDKAMRDLLVALDNKWRADIGLRAERISAVSRSIANLRRSVTAIERQAPALEHMVQFRNKLLAHITVGHIPASKFKLRELWLIARLSLNASRHVRLVFHREDWQYRQPLELAKTSGRALVKALIKAQARA